MVQAGTRKNPPKSEKNSYELKTCAENLLPKSPAPPEIRLKNGWKLPRIRPKSPKIHPKLSKICPRPLKPH